MAIDKKQIDSTIIASYGSFAAWVTAQSTTPISIIIAVDIDLESGTITLPATIDLYGFVNNAKFSNGTLTINKMSARPHHQIFSSNMVVTFAYQAIVLPEWWGAATGIDSTDVIELTLQGTPPATCPTLSDP